VDRDRLAHGELEGLVMDVLWDAGEPLVAGEVRDRLGPARSLAYTTVMTILVRLHEKALVDRERVGRAYAYRPRSTREEQAATRMGELLETAKDDSVVLARFVAALSPAQLSELRRAMEGDGS
jgi:predicted transcriptional regulator